MLFEDFAIQTINHLPIRLKTHVTYSSALRLHIFPVLAHREIAAIKRIEINSVMQGLRPQSAALSLAVIKSIFREALAQGLIDESPAHGVSGPKIMVKPREFLTWEEVSKSSFGKYGAHIHDPLTGMIAIGAKSATVVGAEGWLCDAMATAVMVGGTESAMWFGQPELQGYQLFGVNRHDDTAWEI